MAPPFKVREWIFRQLSEFVGSVPARYSCQFNNPSPSESASRSAGELNSPAVGGAANQLAGSLAYASGSRLCNDKPNPSAPTGQGQESLKFTLSTRTKGTAPAT